MHLFAIPAWFNCLYFVAVAALATWRAGWRERTVAIAQAATTLVSSLVCGVWACPVWLARAPLSPPLVWRPALDDAIVLVLCLICVVRADRYWVILASSFALLGILSDVAVLVPGVTIWAFLSASLVWSYCVSFAVLWGVLTFRPTRAAITPGTGVSAGSAP